MKTNNLGYPRIGTHRELKKANELYWAHQLTSEELAKDAAAIRQKNWLLQQELGIDLIPSNDFSLYDQVLDLTLMLGAIPERFKDLAKTSSPLDLYFAMARGQQELTAMEMTKWFDTNYHYIVPEFTKNQKFELFSTKIIREYREAKQLGIETKPVIIGPLSYLLLGKTKGDNFDRLQLLDQLTEVYFEIINALQKQGATYIQFDEPFLAMQLSDQERKAFTRTYTQIRASFPNLKIILTSYFGTYSENLFAVLDLDFYAIHLDLVRGLADLDTVLACKKRLGQTKVSLGLVDGRNIWKNDFQKSLTLIQKAKEQLGEDRLLIATSCSLLHSPCDLDLEAQNQELQPEIRQWMAFAKQKLQELAVLKTLACQPGSKQATAAYKENLLAIESRSSSPLVHNALVQQRIKALSNNEYRRKSPFIDRRKKQAALLNLPSFPTTTIGSFPQTAELRSLRAQFKNKQLSQQHYDQQLAQFTCQAIDFQEEIGLDVLVHGEFERNDMVEYFGQQLKGFAFTSYGWVQSYGSRCVKPPILYGDVYREQPMTVYWSKYAQSLTKKWVKAMLTGPITLLQWSFVRNDQSRESSCNQLALAINDEVLDLEKAGLKIIQIDEPALREGLPLRREDWEHYLHWAIKAFRICCAGIKDTTQIHTHMCYSEFNDIIQDIAQMDADVITIECSRSQMELLDIFSDFRYPNDIGPGVYDIHSPRIPSKEEMLHLLKKAASVLPKEQLWVNPDCGLKTRHWEETKKALIEMVAAAKDLREIYAT